MSTANREDKRKYFTADQRQELEKAYDLNAYPNNSAIEELARKLKTTQERVRKWFYNRRVQSVNAQRRNDYAAPNSQTANLGSTLVPPLATFSQNSTVGPPGSVNSWTSDQPPQYGLSSHSDLLPPTHPFFRKHFTADQRQELEKAYDRNAHPDGSTIEELARKLKTTQERVRNWFMNRRVQSVNAQRRNDYAAPNSQTTYLGSTLVPPLATFSQNSTVGPPGSVNSWTSDQPPQYGLSCHSDLLPPTHPFLRKYFTADQRQELEKAYDLNAYPNNSAIEELARKLKTTQERVRKWFYNRRVQSVNAQRRNDYAAPNSQTTNLGSTLVPPLATFSQNSTVGPPGSVNSWTSDQPPQYGLSSHSDLLPPTHPFLRKHFTADQRQELEKAYDLNAYPNGSAIEELARKLNTTKERVRTWFKDRRCLTRQTRRRNDYAAPNRQTTNLGSTVDPPIVTSSQSSTVNLPGSVKSSMPETPQFPVRLHFEHGSTPRGSGDRIDHFAADDDKFDEDCTDGVPNEKDLDESNNINSTVATLEEPNSSRDLEDQAVEQQHSVGYCADEWIGLDEWIAKYKKHTKTD